MGERLHKVLGQIGLKLWFPWQQKAPIDFSQLFLIRFFLYLQVTRTCIKSRRSLTLGQIGPLTMELATLERLKFSHRLIMGKWCLQASSFNFDRIFFKFACNQDSHKISDEFEFWLDRISHFGVTCPCGRIKFSTDILWNLQIQSTFQTLEFFVTLFSGCCCLFIPLFLYFSFSLIFNIENFGHTFLGNCEA